MGGLQWKDTQGTSYPDLIRGMFWGTIFFGALLVVLFLVHMFWH
jgi:hypothetical protein